MKILTLSNLYPPDMIGGYEVACKQAVDGLIELGHDVKVLTTVPRQPVDRVGHVDRRFRLADEWNRSVMGPIALVHHSVHARSRLVDAHNVYELLHALETFAPDVVYLGNVAGIGGLGLLSTLQHRGIPWVWQLGDCIPRLLCQSRREIIPELALEFGKRFQGTYIAVSERVRREIECVGIVLGGRVELLPYWITGERPSRTPSYYRGGTLRVMSAGSVNRDKGIHILIESIGHLRSMGIHNVEVDIYGKVGDPSFAEMIKNLGVENQVRLLGHRPHHELIPLYGEYDVFAFPTQAREPFGMVPLEAASQGCVPILAQQCGISEWLVHGVHVLKAARTPESFAATFRDIANGTIDLEPIAKRGFEVAWTDFHLDNVLPKIESLLFEAADQPRHETTSAGEVYRMARLAERLAESLIGEAMGAA